MRANIEELIKTIKYGLDTNKDMITSNGERYVAGVWEEIDYAKENGYEFVGTVVELAREYELI